LKTTVKLQAIIDGTEMQFDNFRTFLNIKTSEIISVSLEDLIAAEDGESFDDLLDWQQEERMAAIDIVEHYGQYVKLPSKYDANDYDIMEDFCLSITDPQKRNRLLRAIQGKGAFRRFKNTIMDFGLAEQWYSYRSERYKEIAIDWCRDHDINFIE